MGVVYKALDTKLDREVALKFLPTQMLGDEDVRKRFEREAKASAALSHANVCHVYEIDKAEDKTFISMELIEGESLYKTIEQGPLKREQVLNIAQQIAAGLEAAHKKGVVHRDIKPENIIIGDDGHPTIMDFGLAQLTQASRLTKANQTMGTVFYMSPEQTEGADTDHRTDIWSPGVVIYEMVTGRHPFKGDYDKAVMYSILNEEPEPMTALRTAVPMQLEYHVAKCLAKNPDERYDAASDLAKDLRAVSEKIRSNRPMQTRVVADPLPESIPAKPARSRRELIPWAIAAASLIGAFTIAASFYLGKTSDTPPATTTRFAFSVGSLDQVVGRRSVAISPNGRHIAFVTGGDDGALWIRDLNSERARLIENSSAAFTPFWSPDNETVGFFSEGELKSAPVSGGPPSTVCEAADTRNRGAAFSPDADWIFFTGEFPTKIFRVRSRGGTPEEILGIDPSSESPTGRVSPQSVRSASGEQFLLFSAGQYYGNTVVLQSLDTAKLHEIVDGTRPFYAASGHLFFERAGDIWALRFSPDDIENPGEPFPVVQDGSFPTVSQNGTLSYADPQVVAQRQLIWTDRTGTTVESLGQPQENLEYPSISPDGNKVVYEAGLDVINDVWIYDLVNGARTRVTSSASSDGRPAWSHDGSFVAFRTDRRGNLDIFQKRADGIGEAEALIATELVESMPHWSNDGRYMVYHASGEQAGRYVHYLERFDGSSKFKSIRHSEEIGTTPRLSPNGRYIAYASSQTGRDEIVVKSFPDGNRRWPISNRGGDEPRWRSDGKELYYLEGEKLMAVPVTTEGEFSMGRPVTLFADSNLVANSNVTNYDVAPDGQRFLMLHVVDASDQPRSIHVQNWYEEFRDRLAPDGQRFLMLQTVVDASDQPRSIHVVQNWYEEFRDRDQD